MLSAFSLIRHSSTIIMINRLHDSCFNDINQRSMVGANAVTKYLAVSYST